MRVYLKEGDELIANGPVGLILDSNSKGGFGVSDSSETEFEFWHEDKQTKFPVEWDDSAQAYYYEDTHEEHRDEG